MDRGARAPKGFRGKAEFAVLREAIETLVLSWTLVIGAKAGPRRVYTIGKNLFSTGGRAREGGKAVGITPASLRNGFSPRR